MGDKVFWFGLGVISTSVGLFALSRLLAPTIKLNLISEIQSRVISRVDVIAPMGVTLSVDPNIQRLVRENISVPLAEGIMNGLYLQ